MTASKEPASGGEDSISGSTIVSGAPVYYDPDITDVSEAQKAADFSFLYCGEPIGKYVNPQTNVTVSGGKVSINLGVPKDEYLFRLPRYITVTPSNAKLFSFYNYTHSDTFYTYNFKHGLYLMKDKYDWNNRLVLIYADRDVTLKGTNTGGEYNMSLKKGWNYEIHSYNETTDTKETITASTTLPGGFKWTIRVLSCRSHAYPCELGLPPHRG